MPGYLIHGTNQPYGVGMRVSHGCVRLYPEDIESLYPLIALGEAVLIVNQPYLVGERDGELFFEAHQPLEDDVVPTEDHLRAVAELDYANVEQLVAQAASIAADAKGVPIRLAMNDLDEILERARVVQNTVEPDPDMLTLAEAREILDAPEDEVATAAGSDDDVVVQ